MKENELQNGMPRSSYIVDGIFEEQERDTKKFWMNGPIRIAALGIENQTDEDTDFPVRGFAYDGAEFRDQLRRRHDIRKINSKRRKQAKKENKIPELIPIPDFYPVITLILYFGNTRWKSPLSLKESLNIPHGLEKYIPDYRINLREISFLDDNTVKKFRSDFKYVAEYFVQTRRAKEGLEPKFTLTLDHINHVNEFMELMNALTKSNKFLDLPRIAEERSNKIMFTYLFDEAEARGISIGEARGISIGEARGEARGADMFAKLTKVLLSLKKYEELSKAAEDPEYRSELYREYRISV